MIERKGCKTFDIEVHGEIGYGRAMGYCNGLEENEVKCAP